MFRHPLVRNRAVVRVPRTRPDNHPRPLAHGHCSDSGAGLAVQGEFARDSLLASVEAALFLADEPLTARKLAGLVGLADAAQARIQIARLKEMYAREGSSFDVEELAGGYQLLTRSEFHPWLARMRSQASETPLSAPAREALAIIAYKQPITRADIEAIRGVGTADVLRQLMERGYIRLAGRDDSLGRPALYETSRKFLVTFGLRSLRDLPPTSG